MKVQARFFALYRERVGQSTLDVELDGSATVGDVIDWVMRRYPKFSPDPSKIVAAVNREYATHGHLLKDGDEVAFIPPVSGGAR